MADALAAVSMGADATGFIFADSPRRADPAIVRQVVAATKGKVLTVGVFVNERLARVKEIVKQCSLDAVQLHGEEEPSYCNRLNGIPIIKAFRIKDGKSLETIPSYENIFAYLLDTYSDKVYGGTGTTFDWSLAIKAKSFGKPIILSGGLGANNIEEAIRVVRPYGVDISSSIESRPGLKDHRRMREVINLIRRMKRA